MPAVNRLAGSFSLSAGEPPKYAFWSPWNSCMVQTLGALTASSRSSCVCRWKARVPGGQAMKSTTFGCFGSRTSTVVMPLLNPWPT